MIDLRLGNCLELMGGGIADRSVDMILTDPPYLIGYRTNRRKDKKHRFCKEIIGDRDIKLVQEFAKQAYRVLKENSAMYCFCHSSKIDIFKQIICEQGFTLKNIIIWEKNNHTAGDLKAQYGKQYEMILYANKGRRVFSSGRKRYTDIWQFARVPSSKAVHQNQKPIGLLERAILNSSEENEIILDPFMGSGSTGVACVNTGRNFIGIEIDKNYFEIAKKRIEEAQVQLNLT